MSIATPTVLHYMALEFLIWGDETAPGDQVRVWILHAVEQCSPNPGPRTGAGPWINRHRAARGTSNHFTVAGGRGAEHCALPSGPRKNYQTFTGPRR
ncbi:hypothetical protein NDU88_010108 [Pleurodeles waltl]|uniref:Uncharacterized protein n=1 Tax=Pleurodeles waltl TaxID=8319 RepID=A0AAV7PUS3_PLEWA|nr:hypothetical protein NDU88_010108 [Pleurodeles waltl]